VCAQWPDSVICRELVHGDLLPRLLWASSGLGVPPPGRCALCIAESKDAVLDKSEDRLIVSVSQGEIEVILPGTDFRAVYYKPTGEPQLLAKRPPNGSHEFKARAWWEACQMARQLGWIV